MSEILDQVIKRFADVAPHLITAQMAGKIYAELNHSGYHERTQYLSTHMFDRWQLDRGSDRKVVISYVFDVRSAELMVRVWCERSGTDYLRIKVSRRSLEFNRHDYRLGEMYHEAYEKFLVDGKSADWCMIYTNKPVEINPVIAHGYIPMERTSFDIYVDRHLLEVATASDSELVKNRALLMHLIVNSDFPNWKHHETPLRWVPSLLEVVRNLETASKEQFRKMMSAAPASAVAFLERFKETPAFSSQIRKAYGIDLGSEIDLGDWLDE